MTSPEVTDRTRTSSPAGPELRVNDCPKNVRAGLRCQIHYRDTNRRPVAKDRTNKSYCCLPVFNYIDENCRSTCFFPFFFIFIYLFVFNYFYELFRTN